VIALLAEQQPTSAAAPCRPRHGSVLVSMIVLVGGLGELAGAGAPRR
jgi:hypothetical protein